MSDYWLSSGHHLVDRNADGRLVVTVPWDFFLSPFFLLFNLNCLYLGYIRGSRYHRYRCGHIHHHLTLVTRTTKDIAVTGVALFNPWPTLP